MSFKPREYQQQGYNDVLNAFSIVLLKNKYYI